MLRYFRLLRGFLPGLAVLFCASIACGGDSPADSFMYHSPEFSVPRIVVELQKREIDLWIKVLDESNQEMKCVAAQSIAVAHKRGMKGLDAAIPKLQEVLNRTDTLSTTRLAIAQSLIALDAKQCADSLFGLLSSDDPELRELVEPALAKWDYLPIRSVWLDRLRQGPPHHRKHLLAISGLGAVREERAVPLIRNLLFSATVSKSVRVEAARAMGTIHTSGLEKDAESLLADGALSKANPQLLAALLLKKHKGNEAVKLLQLLGKSQDSTAAAAALARLNEIDGNLVKPILDSVFASPDANVRLLGVMALFQHRDDSNIRYFKPRLSDPHPQVRTQARLALIDLGSRAESRDLVIATAKKVLAQSDWQGQEQAAILLVHFDHKPAAERLVELLTVNRPESFVTAAWALRKLAVKETLPAVHKYIGDIHQKLLASGPSAGRGAPPEAIDQQLSHLIQFLGQARYLPADKLLRIILPRSAQQPGKPNPIGMETRAAAAWALGLINEDQANKSELIAMLEARATDFLPGPAGVEFECVRQMSVVSLGRLKSKGSVPILRKYYGGKPTFSGMNNACGWAIEQITGEPVPPPETLHKNLVGWLLNFME